MFRLIVGSLVTALVLFAWGFVVWAVSGLMFQVVKHLPGDTAATLKSSLPETGTYIYPLPNETKNDEERKAEEARIGKLSKEGPIVTVFYHKEGSDMNDPTVFALGFLHFFLSALLAGMALQMAAPALTSYCRRVCLVFLIGLFAAVVCHLGIPIWLHHPWGFYLFEAAYVASGWLLAALVMAAIIRSKPAVTK